MTYPEVYVDTRERRNVCHKVHRPTFLTHSSRKYYRKCVRPTGPRGQPRSTNTGTGATLTVGRDVTSGLLTSPPFTRTEGIWPQLKVPCQEGVRKSFGVRFFGSSPQDKVDTEPQGGCNLELSTGYSSQERCVTKGSIGSHVSSSWYLFPSSPWGVGGEEPQTRNRWSRELGREWLIGRKTDNETN